VTDLLGQLLRDASAHPLIQGLAIILATFILEDPTTIGAGLLVAEDRMAFVTAFVALTVGISLGDFGLFWVGRLAGPRVVRWGLVSPARLERANRWFQRNLVAAVILSRFLPGMRTPTYIAAGIARASARRFVIVAVAASLVWSYLLLHLTVALGDAVMPMLGRYRWPVAAVVLLVLVIVQQRAGRAAVSRREARGTPVVSPFELWPPLLFYAPVALHWLWLSIRYRGILLPTAANPSIYSGGFLGESKSEILALVPGEQRHWVAPWVVVGRSEEEAVTVAAAEAALEAGGLAYPVVAKPDIGQRGAGVRVVRTRDDLVAYVAAFPAGARILLQRLVVDVAALPPAPEGAGVEAAREAGVLYWRLPGDERGGIFSLTLKVFPQVIGDGRRTVEELIDADARAHRLRDLYLERLGERAARVPAAGERVALVFAGNHCQGTIFLDGSARVTEAMVRRFDEIARSIPEFWFGRFDVRFSSLAELERGEGFQIVEINGASAEATHIWDASMTLREAYRTLFRQFDVLFRIGAANRRRGYRPLSLRRFLRDVIAVHRLAARYPATE